jgi:hypothetical protein
MDDRHALGVTRKMDATAKHDRQDVVEIFHFSRLMRKGVDA